MRKPRPPIQFTEKMRKRFMRHVRVSESGCWIWTATRNAKGYGHFFIDGDMYRANRVAFEMATGRYPGALVVCHRCDNPSCVNPEHLWLGTHQDNIRDCHAKGRHPRSLSRRAA